MIWTNLAVGSTLTRQTTEQNVHIRHHHFHVDFLLLFMRIVRTVGIKAAAYITPDPQHANAKNLLTSLSITLNIIECKCFYQI